MFAVLYRSAGVRDGFVVGDCGRRRGGVHRAAGRAISGHCSADDRHLDRLSGGQRKIVAETVATPIEVEVNGVERMLYMSSAAGTTAR